MSEAAILTLIHDEIAWPLRYPRVPDVLTEDMRFDDLNLGLVDIVCIQCRLDEELGIEIPCAKARAWESIADVLATVGEMVGERV